uniref:MYC associated factor X n=1 Tax=Myotis myotis TaxID=51298 RepID=A0A7J8ANS9_MYOMY|nr:MYC associated factor X [Myotis myotis]
MSDNDDIEVESDVSPWVSSFPWGLSGGDSRDSGPALSGATAAGGRAAAACLPPSGWDRLRRPPGSLPCGLPAERPSESGGGEETCGLWDPHLSRGGGCCGLPLPPDRAPETGTGTGKSNRGFNLRLTNGLIIMHWNESVGTTSKTAFTVCGTRSHHSKERSPCTGESEVECPTADQLPFLRKQPLHQRQGQRHLCLRWGLGLQLRVGA